MANITNGNSSLPSSSASSSRQIAQNNSVVTESLPFNPVNLGTSATDELLGKIDDALSSAPLATAIPTLSATPNILYRYQWNLPPHQWSMPVEPSTMIGNTVVNQKVRQLNIGVSDRYRRGRIYWYARPGNTYATSTGNNNGTNKKDPRYGFQFLWNPDTITTSVAVNLDITPTFADKFVDVAGAFPSGEALAFTIRLDRTNDFACIQGIAPGAANPSEDQIAKKFADKQYYDLAGTFDTTGSYQDYFKNKIKELRKLGTIADIEYLYKAINGPGWTNQATGRDSSDIGFLSPTLLRVDIGPLSYLGYVNNISVSHIAFNRSMVPIRTDVSLQFNLMATAGLATK
jgi:hypothetical protein